MSIRTRLTLSYVGFFAIALLTLHVGLYLIVRSVLLNSVDNELRLGVEVLRRGFAESNQTAYGYFRDDQLRAILLRQPPVRDFEATSLYVQFFDADGDLVGRSPNIGDGDLATALTLDEQRFALALDGVEQITTVEYGNVHIRELMAPLRYFNPVTRREEVVGVLQVARSMAETRYALQLLFYALTVGGVVVLLAAARGGAWLTRAAFRPIDEIAQTAQSIVRAEDLSRRISVPPAADELQRLTITVNDLLARLEELFNHQRRFIADVSHELRTPLTAMQGNLEVLARGAARDPQLLNESINDMRREVARLIRMVNDLLLLARSDAGIQIRRELVELDTLLLETHRELRPLAGQVQLRIGDEDQVTVIGDRDRIKQALLNLGVNAIQHTPPGGIVTLSLAIRDGYAALSVADTGCGIASQDLPHIFERFYRADRSRCHNGSGAGLGLSIVHSVVEAHGGQVLVSSEPGKGSVFTMLLPLALQSEGAATPASNSVPDGVPQTADTGVDVE
jgi:signal transduction histidine kinase